MFLPGRMWGVGGRLLASCRPGSSRGKHTQSATPPGSPSWPPDLSLNSQIYLKMFLVSLSLALITYCIDSWSRTDTMALGVDLHLDRLCRAREMVRPWPYGALCPLVLGTKTSERTAFRFLSSTRYLKPGVFHKTKGFRSLRFSKPSSAACAEPRVGSLGRKTVLQASPGPSPPAQLIAPFQRHLLSGSPLWMR